MQSMSQLLGLGHYVYCNNHAICLTAKDNYHACTTLGIISSARPWLTSRSLPYQGHDHQHSSEVPPKYKTTIHVQNIRAVIQGMGGRS